MALARLGFVRGEAANDLSFWFFDDSLTLSRLEYWYYDLL